MGKTKYWTFGWIKIDSYVQKEWHHGSWSPDQLPSTRRRVVSHRSLGVDSYMRSEQEVPLTLLVTSIDVLLLGRVPLESASLSLLTTAFGGGINEASETTLRQKPVSTVCTWLS